MQENNDRVASDAAYQPRKKWFSPVMIIVIVSFGLLLIVGVLTKRIAIAVMPGSSAQVTTQVCGVDDIANFNDNFANEDFSKTIETIQQRSSYNDDVNCVYIEYRYYYDRQQYAKASERAVRVEELVKAGNFINNQINGVQSIVVIQQNTEAVQGLPDGGSVDETGEE
ncbi:MAG TPA: hypothetical protein PKD68_03925 [Candidatus Saccharibacteria bacterium]|nr:hypothetical protein [Candidatus Saccharibacteria bacterium]